MAPRQLRSVQMAPWKLADQGRGEGEARLVESDGDWAVVESTQPFPIGATLCGSDPETSTEYRVKVRAGRRVDETWFRIEGRFVSLTREQRERLLASFGI
jgi:hypothetical protein